MLQWKQAEPLAHPQIHPTSLWKFLTFYNTQLEETRLREAAGPISSDRQIHVSFPTKRINSEKKKTKITSIFDLPLATSCQNRLDCYMGSPTPTAALPQLILPKKGPYNSIVLPIESNPQLKALRTPFLK